MLRLIIPPAELYDEITNEFVYTKSQALQLEHSLVSISKWESKWKKSFIANTKPTIKESIDYIKCMTLTQNVDDDVYKHITSKVIDEVSAYIDDGMSATTFMKSHDPGTGEIVTSELIYYWMIILGVPFECQKWHLNRLLMLINVCNIKNQPEKHISRSEIYARNAKINADRKKAANSNG